MVVGNKKQTAGFLQQSDGNAIWLLRHLFNICYAIPPFRDHGVRVQRQVLEEYLPGCRCHLTIV